MDSSRYHRTLDRSLCFKCNVVEFLEFQKWLLQIWRRGIDLIKREKRFIFDSSKRKLSNCFKFILVDGICNNNRYKLEIEISCTLIRIISFPYFYPLYNPLYLYIIISLISLLSLYYLYIYPYISLYLYIISILFLKRQFNHVKFSIIYVSNCQTSRLKKKKKKKNRSSRFKSP